MCLHPLAWTNVSSEKNACFAIWAHVGTKFLNYVPSFPIYGWLAWWCDFFPVRATCEDHPQVFKQKKSSPLHFFLTPAPRPLEVTPLYFLWLVKLNMCVCTLLQGQMYSQQKTCVLQFGRALTQNS